MFCASGAHVLERTLRSGSQTLLFSTRPDLKLFAFAAFNPKEE
jgi:hypothetical protein